MPRITIDTIVFSTVSNHTIIKPACGSFNSTENTIVANKSRTVMPNIQAKDALKVYWRLIFVNSMFFCSIVAPKLLQPFSSFFVFKKYRLKTSATKHTKITTYTTPSFWTASTSPKFYKYLSIFISAEPIPHCEWAWTLTTWYFSLRVYEVILDVSLLRVLYR